MSRNSKPRIWFVDDLECKRDEFKEKHSYDFDLTLFSTPDEVLRALDSQEPPDALLCDIYFFGKDAAKIEEEVNKIALESERVAKHYHAEKCEAGIGLIESLRHRFKGFRQIPIYAHTSKGPYLIQGAGFERLSKAGALWLFKGRFSPEVERQIIYRDIEELQQRFGFKARIKHYLAAFVFVLFGAIFGGLISWGLGRALDTLWPINK